MHSLKHLFCALALISLANPLGGAPRGPMRNNEQKSDPIPHIMVANFFNILANGLIAISSKENPEQQMQATAQVLNSIAALAQLAMRNVKVVRKNDPDTTAREIYENLMHDEAFIRELEVQRPDIHAALVAVIQQNFVEQAEPHTAHAQID